MLKTYINKLKLDDSELAQCIVEAYQTLYHGTPKVYGDFEYHATGKGNDALGPGFYFTNNPQTASGYAGTEHGANVRAVRLDIEKPIIIDRNKDTKQKPLTRLQIKKLLIASPYFEDSLYNYGDWGTYGKHTVLNDAIDAFSGSDLYRQLSMIMGDFYNDELKEFAPRCKKLVGYDGIIYNLGEGLSEDGNDEVHYVAWLPSQIKSIYQK